MRERVRGGGKFSSPGLLVQYYIDIDVLLTIGWLGLILKCVFDVLQPSAFITAYAKGAQHKRPGQKVTQLGKRKGQPEVSVEASSEVSLTVCLDCPARENSANQYLHIYS